MKKNIFMMVVVLLFVACSEKKVEPKAPASEKIDIRTSKADKSVPVEKNVPADFVPEHIRKSKIEVVKRY